MPKQLQRQDIQGHLQEIPQPRKTYHEPIYLAEGLEAEDLGCKVGYGGVVEGSVEGEEDDIRIRGGEAMGDAAQDADEGRVADERG